MITVTTSSKATEGVKRRNRRCTHSLPRMHLQFDIQNTNKNYITKVQTTK